MGKKAAVPVILFVIILLLTLGPAHIFSCYGLRIDCDEAIIFLDSVTGHWKNGDELWVRQCLTGRTFAVRGYHLGCVTTRGE